ncbi:conserved hypothetical protein [Ricinus communis]|uniref:Uncharacterized protein n=1 Tax=Ricinus communis TaxID=3988 RepID=B9RPF6_RICCO|nr:conserved hypothetical protein [Ricinus communis]
MVTMELSSTKGEQPNHKPEEQVGQRETKTETETKYQNLRRKAKCRQYPNSGCLKPKKLTAILEKLQNSRSEINIRRRLKMFF